MRGPKVMIAVIIVTLLGTMGYAMYLSGSFSIASAASAKSTPSARMLDRELTEADRAMGRR